MKNALKNGPRSRAELLPPVLILAAVSLLARGALIRAERAPRVWARTLDCEGVSDIRPAGPCPDHARYLLGEKMNLNTAGVSDLALLPGLGPRTAQKIVAARNAAGGFQDRAEVLLLPGLSAPARHSLNQWTEVR